MFYIWKSVVIVLDILIVGWFIKFEKSFVILLNWKYLLFGDVLRLLGYWAPELSILATLGLSPKFFNLDFYDTSKFIWLVQ
jgi:hypothetical protein